MPEKITYHQSLRPNT